MKTKRFAAAIAAVALFAGIAVGEALGGDHGAQSPPPGSALSRQPAEGVCPAQVHYLFQDAEARSADRSPSCTRARAGDEECDPLPRFDIRYRIVWDPEGEWLIERDWVRPIPGGKREILIHGFLLATDR